MADADMMLVRKGAEANIYLTSFMNRKVIVKKRISKGYRIDEVDRKIRDYRTVHESQLLHEAKKTGVPTPTVYLVDRAESAIIMKFAEGKRLKDLLGHGSARTEKLCFKLGKLVGMLHRRGIIHGDLTTSNSIVSSDGVIFLLDFGLGFYSDSVEAQGVDLHLLKQVFQSFHYDIAKNCFNTVLKGYETVIGRKKLMEIKRKIREIEGRGRYIPPEARYLS